MIPAKKNKYFDFVFTIYLKRLLKSSFDKVYWHSKIDIPASPVLFIANHSSWWDGLLFHHLSRTVIKHDLYMMMHESGLKQYPFFRRLGAFSVNRTHPKDILRSLQYAEQLLQDGETVCLFPQGDEFHIEKRPLQFQTGATYLVERHPEIAIVPLSFYYSFGHNKKPEVWIQAGRPLYDADLFGNQRKDKTQALEQICTLQLDELKGRVVHEQHALFSNLI